MKDFISVKDVAEPRILVEKALQVKYNPLQRSWAGQGKSICLLFFNSSLRTRLSVQKAAFNLGIDVSIFNVGQDGWQLEMEEGVVMNGDKAEHITEAVQVISRYADIIGIRHFASLKDREADFSEKLINAFKKHSNKPLLNLESATVHPLQSLADMMTIQEHQSKEAPKVVLTWAPHPRALPQAVPNSFSEWVLAMGWDLTICQPKGYELDKAFTNGAKIEYSQDEAFKKADFIYAKNWSASEPYGSILNQDESWRITSEKMALNENSRFMHCLPVRRNVIVDDAVLGSPKSIVMEQAENRIYAAQVVIDEMLRNTK